ncbi:Dps family protein [Paractinoplanes rishiriensis]|uniref:DNA starvation/stationary phase protection protein n=1 Tax=Paractinoplanes rishiriensis TaxID=1050105 RepID=A0A919K861_9ACTN|nr:DNA starvation/stationary phase protection protein [Actinoplanes rishiriensis]GIF01148.1 DNA starvation/stationary phase protection protein [Actinoplanes rishiriensis]
MTTSTRHTSVPGYTVPGLKPDTASEMIVVLQVRLNALNDLALILKHVHWNVVGPHFMAVHTMLDPQVDAVRAMVDDLAERIAALGGSPVGTSSALMAQPDWTDYPIDRAHTGVHLAALDVVFTRIVEAHRAAIDQAGNADPVTHDMLIGQAGALEQFHWFIRAHLDSDAGSLSPTTS